MSHQIEALPERMQNKIEKSAEGCWLWTGAKTAKGYALWAPDPEHKRLLANKTKRAHRIIYQLLIGPIPEGLQLDHVCRVKHCVNPAHMEPCTNRENTVRAFIAAGFNTDGRLL